MSAVQGALSRLLSQTQAPAPGAGAGALLPPPSPLGAPPGQAMPAPPPLDPNAEPPAYDVAKDPGWHGQVDPHNHPLRMLLSGMSPEERELLRAWKNDGARTQGVGGNGQPIQGRPQTGSYVIDGKRYDFDWNGERKPTPQEILQAYARNRAQQEQARLLNQQMLPGAGPPGVPPDAQVPLNQLPIPGQV